MIVRGILVVILLGYAMFCLWFVNALTEAGQEMANYQTELSKPAPTPVDIVRFEGIKKGLVIPSWSWLETDRIWALISAKSTVGIDYVPELTTITVAKGNWMYDDRIRPEVNQALIELFDHAQNSSHPLIITSAYRSAAEQRDLYNSSAASYGNDWAESHVAKPGQSEHQTGLAVDFSSYTSNCVISFPGCDLKPDTANWLAKNASDYGFILRYPADKSQITGISYEPWHYRYVGKDLAKVVDESGLTLDEVLLQLIRHRDQT